MIIWSSKLNKKRVADGPKIRTPPMSWISLNCKQWVGVVYTQDTVSIKGSWPSCLLEKKVTWQIWQNHQITTAPANKGIILWILWRLLWFYISSSSSRCPREPAKSQHCWTRSHVSTSFDTFCTGRHSAWSVYICGRYMCVVVILCGQCDEDGHWRLFSHQIAEYKYFCVSHLAFSTKFKTLDGAVFSMFKSEIVWYVCHDTTIYGIFV